MDRLDFLEDEKLQQFFHCKKTEISCVKNPQTLLNQLRDHNLIPEDTYKKMRDMKNKDQLKMRLYEYLDWLERKGKIRDFWRCMFEEIILDEYPTMKKLHDSLMDGSFLFYTNLQEEIEENDKGKKKQLSEDEQDEEIPAVKKKKTPRSKRVCDDDDDDDEQPGPSSQLTGNPMKKKKKIHFSSPLKRGETGDIWTWPIYKVQLPVTCGEKEGILNRDRLAKGEECITVGKKWFTPTQFERFAGLETRKNWKTSIQCNNVCLKKLIEEGHLKVVPYKRGTQRVAKELFPHDLDTVSDREDEDEEEDSSHGGSSTNTSDEEEEEMEEIQQPGVSTDNPMKMYKVTCGAQNAILSVQRFASGKRGKSIRTETSWMTPEEFVNSALGQTEASWKKVIKWKEHPVSVLIERRILVVHPLPCRCRFCEPKEKDVEDQKNDDECCICKKGGDLLLCDGCPRAFHQTCHLPHLEDSISQDNGEWLCTFCVFRASQKWTFPGQLRRDTVMSQQISKHMMKCQYLLLFLFSADEEQTFEIDPRLYLDDYSTIIKTPMWLKRIAEKHDKKYRTVGQFVSDVQLIFTNCKLYNKENAKYLKMGMRLKELFEEELKKVFNIKD